MASFEIVVRPVVFPDIRPRARPSLPPDDPESGLAEITGNPAQGIGLSESWSISSSQSRPVETERRVDTARVYQVDDSGEVNRDNYVDIDVANRITMRDGGDDGFAVPGDAPGVTRSKTKQGVYYYHPVKETDNIEIQERNIIQKADDE